MGVRTRAVRDDWSIAILGSILFVLSGLVLIDYTPDGRFLLGTAAGSLVVSGVLWYALAAAPDRQTVTLAGWITIARGSALALLAGFIAIEAFGGWVPATLFGLAAGLDVVDGRVARARDTVSSAGERLDEGMDTLTVLFGTVVVVLAGLASPFFLVAALAKFIFQAGIWSRRRRGRTITPLDDRLLRKALSAVLLVSIWIALFPITDATITRWLTWAALVPFCLHFGRDWLVVSGRR